VPPGAEPSDVLGVRVIDYPERALAQRLVAGGAVRSEEVEILAYDMAARWLGSTPCPP